MNLRKMDLLFYNRRYHQVLVQATLEHSGTLTAYARRSPLGSEDSWVGWPRVVDGDGAQIASTLSVQLLSLHMQPKL